MILKTYKWDREQQESLIPRTAPSSKVRGKKVVKQQFYPRPDWLCYDIDNKRVEYWDEGQESHKTTIYTRDRSLMLWYWKPTGGILGGKKVVKIQYTQGQITYAMILKTIRLNTDWGANICWTLTCELWARYHHHHLTINWKFWVTTSSERERERASQFLPRSLSPTSSPNAF